MALCNICNIDYSDICGNCISIQQTCVLCLTKIDRNETVIRCKECHYLGHQENYSVWLSKHGSCPACRIEYSEDHFDEITLDDGVIRQLYLDKSSVYFKRNQIFSEFTFRHPFYNFQQNIVNDIHDQLKFDDSHLLISPPGSGKTIIGLAIVSLLSVNTLVLTPNLAVLGSWIDRLSMFYDKDESRIKLSQVYTRSKGDLKPITITTYQQINTSLRDYNKQGAKSPKSKKLMLKKGGVNYIDRLKNHEIGLIILDEAHRLTGTWGEDIIKLIDMIGEVKILGLTATPPQQQDDEFDLIFTDRHTEIPLPMMVREEVLAPFRDYTLIFPSKDELEKMEKELFDYSRLVNSPYTEVKSDLIARTLKEIVFLENNNSSEKSYHQRWLSSNLSYYIQMAIDVILFELETLNKDFRGLVLLEQENIPNKYPYPKYTGIGGAIGLFETLLKIPNIDIIDPVFVTGKSLIIDSDFAEKFKIQGQEWVNANNLDMIFKLKKTRKNYTIINGSGSDWNTDTYTRFVTHLFAMGYTKLLIGTRFLLGEGWDSQVLNTVIDLTTFSSYAFVNQVKGRALRKDPDNPNKVSNMWEFAPYPYNTPISLSEYENYLKRHQIYFGINDKGEIVNGISRLNPHLINIKNRYVKYDVQKQQLFANAQDRLSPIILWRVGQKLGDLFYVLNITLDLPPIVGTIYIDKTTDIRSYLRKLIHRRLSSIILPGKDFIIKIHISFSKNMKEFKIKVAIPISVDFDELPLIKEKLESSNPSQTIGLQLRYHKYRKKWVSILLSFFGRDVTTFYEDILLTLPWNISLLDAQDILANINSESAYTIEKIREHTNLIEIDKITPKHILTIESVISQSNESEISLIQIINKAKMVEALGPKIDYTFKINTREVLLDQEYIDDDILIQMDQLSNNWK